MTSSVHPSEVRKLLNALGFGKQNALLGPQLKELTGIDERTQRKIVHEIDGTHQTIRGRSVYVIVGTGTAGRWICESYEEAEETTSQIRSAVRELSERLQRRESAVRQAFPAGPMQKSLF